MRKLWENKVSRRKLLGGAAATGAAIPVLHDMVPHQNLHGGTSAAQAAVEHHRQAHRCRRQGHRGGTGRQVRRLDLQRPRARPDPAGASGRAAAHQLHERLEPPAHDPLPRDPPRRHGRRAGGRRGQHRRGRVDRLRVRRRAVRAAPLPLPLDPAGRAHRQGPLRRLHHRPGGRPPGRRRARDGDERVRHQLRQVQRGLRGQHGRVRIHGPADPGEARRAGADLPGEPARVRLRQLVSHPRQLLRLLPDRHPARAARLHRHGHPGAGRAGHPRAALPLHREVHVPRPRFRVCGIGVDGLLRGRRLMEVGALTRTRRPPRWVAGLAPLVVLAVAIGLFVALDAPGLDRIGVPEEELTVERTVLEPGLIELHLRNDGADAVRIEQAIVNDGFASFTQTNEEVGRLAATEVDVQYPWIEGQAYEVILITSTGGTIDHAIDVAVETPDADLGFYGLMALIGLYVGVIPVAIGMLWLPWVRTIDARWMRFLLAFTVGLLAFLGIDALLEGTELAGTGAGAA